MAFVVAGGPVRNRGWVVGSHIAALRANGVDRVFHLVNDCEDDTEAVVRGAGEDYAVRNTGVRGWHRFGHDPETFPKRYKYDIENLARLRNAWAELALASWPEATHLWSCDSDVLPEPGALDLLLALDKPAVAAPVRNGLAHWSFCGMLGDERHLTHMLLPETNEPFRVDLTGACFLIRRDVFEAGVRWRATDMGEDAGFALECRERGIEQWVEPRAHTTHCWSEARALPSHGPILALTGGSEYPQLNTTAVPASA